MGAAKMTRRNNLYFLGIVGIGLLAGLVFGPRSVIGEEDFTVVLIPDTQYYTQQSPVNNTYSAQTQWIKNNAAAENIKFTIHLGDIVQDRNSVESEWQIADAAHDILESGPNPVPYSIMPGNHDLEGSGSPDYTRDTTKYNEYFGVSRFSGQSWYGGHRGATNENNFSFFSAGDLDFMVVCLEPLPTDATLDWANTLVQSHPNHRVILTTHVYLNSDGSRSTARTYEGLQGNNANDIFDKLVKNNSNIFMSLCGHRCYEALNTAFNSQGKPVYEVMSDYQYEPNGGNGWFRTLRFKPSENKITLGSYSPTLDQHNRYGTFSVAYDMGGTIVVPDDDPAILAAYWDFETGGQDRIGNSTMAFQSGATIVPGRFGNGLRLTDSSTYGYASTGADPDLDRSSQFSVAMWVAYDDTDDPYGRLISRMEDADNGYNIAMADATSSSSQVIVRILADGISYHVTTSVAITRDVFHHVAFSFDDEAGPSATEKIQVWIDGNLIPTSDTSTAGGVQGTTDLVLGKGTATSADFAGILDEVRFYHGVLTASQVAALQMLPIPGDANGDGAVNDKDASLLAAHWGETVNPGNLAFGDFNGDGKVNAKDASIMVANWTGNGGETGPGILGMPEPSTLILIAMGVLMLSMIRRGVCRDA